MCVELSSRHMQLSEVNYCSPMNVWQKLSIIVNQARKKQNQLFDINLKLMFSPWETYRNVAAVYFWSFKQRDICI